MQEYIGYCLIPSNKGQRMMVIKGSGGEGKSQIGAVLGTLFGSNMKDGSIGKISENRFARADLEHILLLSLIHILYDYLHLLESWKVQYAPKTPEDVLDDRFVEACQMLDYVEYLADLLIAAELEQRVKIVEMLNKDGLIAGLEERLDRLKKEDDAYEKQSAA